MNIDSKECDFPIETVKIQAATQAAKPKKQQVIGLFVVAACVLLTSFLKWQSPQNNQPTNKTISPKKPESFLSLPKNVFAPEPIKESPKPALAKTLSGNELGEVKDQTNSWLRTVTALQNNGSLKSMETETEAASKFLSQLADRKEVPFLRFFSVYDLPSESASIITLGGKQSAVSLRQSSLLVLSFVLNSTAGIEKNQGNIIIPKMVPGSDTLCFINIEDFGWSAEQWERVARNDPYVVAPLTTQGGMKANKLVLRADWFIVQATDVQRQVDSKVPELIYYTLLFDKSLPKNGTEFRKSLGIDLANALKNNLDRRVVLEAGKSGVSVETGGNRKIQGVRTPYGYYWETFDTKNLDYLNNLETDDRLKDAGEIIASHKNGTQIYFLLNQDDDRVNYADNGLVEDSGPLGKRGARPIDRRIKTAISCIICHTSGINPMDNSVTESLHEGVKIDVLSLPQAAVYENYQAFRKARDKYLRLDRKFVNNSINETINSDNKIYEQAVANCNGLNPSQNAYCLWSIRDWYDQPINLQQAACECGVPIAQFTASNSQSFSARVRRIVVSNKFSIPRRYWESINPPGDYAQSMLTLKFRNQEAVNRELKIYSQRIMQPVEEPKHEEPKHEEPKHEEPKHEEPKHEEPKHEEPKHEEPKHEEPKHEEPKQVPGIIALQDCPITVSKNGWEITFGILKKGESIEYTSFKEPWYQVNYDNRIGFVYSKYVNKTLIEEPNKKGTQ